MGQVGIRINEEHEQNVVVADNATHEIRIIGSRFDRTRCINERSSICRQNIIGMVVLHI